MDTVKNNFVTIVMRFTTKLALYNQNTAEKSLSIRNAIQRHCLNMEESFLQPRLHFC